MGLILCPEPNIHSHYSPRKIKSTREAEFYWATPSLSSLVGCIVAVTRLLAIQEDNEQSATHSGTDQAVRARGLNGQQFAWLKLVGLLVLVSLLL
jgi:hypothetical protein